MDFALNAQPMELYVPVVKSGVAYRIWQVVTSTAFEYFILFLITVNTLILMMKARKFLFYFFFYAIYLISNQKI
jgi:hypothetical protein